MKHITFRRVRAFLLGVREFRQAFTTYFGDWRLDDAYDRGREFAHRVTFRRFED